jgi:hypothetical protein
VSIAPELPSSQSTSPSHPPRLSAVVGAEVGPRSPPKLCRRRQAPPPRHPLATSSSTAFPGGPLPPPPCPAPLCCLPRALYEDLIEDLSPASPQQPHHRGRPGRSDRAMGTRPLCRWHGATRMLSRLGQAAPPWPLAVSRSETVHQL